jgi:hypothetical protein
MSMDTILNAPSTTHAIQVLLLGDTAVASANGALLFGRMPLPTYKPVTVADTRATYRVSASVPSDVAAPVVVPSAPPGAYVVLLNAHCGGIGGLGDGGGCGGCGGGAPAV